MSTAISPTCRKRLHVQGYDNYSDKDLNDYKYGFAYGGCIAVVVLGVYFQRILILSVTALIAFVAGIPSLSPLDYIYNYGVRYVLKKPKLPLKTKQGRFARIASVWLTALSVGFALPVY